MLHFLCSQTILCTKLCKCRVQFDYPKSGAYIKDILLYYICYTFWVVKLYSAIAEYAALFGLSNYTLNKKRSAIFLMHLQGFWSCFSKTHLQTSFGLVVNIKDILNKLNDLRLLFGFFFLTDGQLNGRPLVILESLSRLKSPSLVLGLRWKGGWLYSTFSSSAFVV